MFRARSLLPHPHTLMQQRHQVPGLVLLAFFPERWGGTEKELRVPSLSGPCPPSQRCGMDGSKGDGFGSVPGTFL